MNNENDMKNLENFRAEGQIMSDIVNLINNPIVIDAVLNYIASEEKGPEEQFFDKRTRVGNDASNEGGAAT